MTKAEFIKKYKGAVPDFNGRTPWKTWNDLVVDMDKDLDSVINSLPPIQKSAQITPLVNVDEFKNWVLKKTGISEREFSNKIWFPNDGLANIMGDDKRATFTAENETENAILNQCLKNFFEEFPEFNGKLTIVYIEN